MSIEEEASSLRERNQAKAERGVEEYEKEAKRNSRWYEVVFEEKKLGFKIALSRYASNANSRARNWCTISIKEAASKEILPSDELVRVNKKIIAIRDDDDFHDYDRIQAFSQIQKSIANAERPLTIAFIRGAENPSLSARNEKLESQNMDTHDKASIVHSFLQDGTMLKNKIDQITHQNDAQVMARKIARMARARVISVRSLENILQCPREALEEARATDAYVTAKRAMLAIDLLPTSQPSSPKTPSYSPTPIVERRRKVLPPPTFQVPESSKMVQDVLDRVTNVLNKKCATTPTIPDGRDPFMTTLHDSDTNDAKMRQENEFKITTVTPSPARVQKRHISTIDDNNELNRRITLESSSKSSNTDTPTLHSHQDTSDQAYTSDNEDIKLHVLTDTQPHIAKESSETNLDSSLTPSRKDSESSIALLYDKATHQLLAEVAKKEAAIAAMRQELLARRLQSYNELSCAQVLEPRPPSAPRTGPKRPQPLSYTKSSSFKRTLFPTSVTPS